MPRGQPQQTAPGPVLFQLCRAGERFEVGIGPLDLARHKGLVLGRASAGAGDGRESDELFRVDDPWMSSRHAAIEQQGEDRVIRDLGSTNGVLVNGVGVKEWVLQDGDLVETGRTFWLYRFLPGGGALGPAPATLGGMLSWSPALRPQVELLRQAATSSNHLLLRGEVGAGKKFCARAIHHVSGRSGPLIRVDCAAEVEHLAAEMLGDQDARDGALAQASSGTLVLDNVERMPAEEQAALVDVLKTSAVTPLSGGPAMPVDLRVLALTSANLEEAARRKKFSLALLEQLCGITVELPPLRERREDLGIMLDAVAARAGGLNAISREACRAMLLHRWPHNALELVKVMELALLLAAEGCVDVTHLPGLIASRATFPLETDENPLPSVPSNPPGRRGSSSRSAGLEPMTAQPVPPPVRPSRSGEASVSRVPVRRDGVRRAPVPTPLATVTAAPIKRGPRVSKDGVDERDVVAHLRRAKGNVAVAAKAMGRPRADFQRLLQEFGLDPALYR